MKIYNTLTQKKEEFVPLEEGKVRMYVCGPTVYNYIHIGNARPAILFDTLRRYLEYRGYEVNYVSNFTDVDDKIIKKANEEGVSAAEISERYIEEFRTDMDALNIREATVHPKATQEIDGMIEMISDLIKKGHAYEKNGTVYFSTRSFKEYGKLSKKKIDDLEAGIRIAVSEEKEDPMDFVLWKPKKEGEPSWPSPWSDGRPGWHIECSVMSRKYLGEQIDIHAGGEDLVFPHHENEIAQSEAANGKQFARYWMHNAFLNIDNKKMSKSAGNFFTVREICEQYDPQVIRFFMLNSHYRSQLNFSRDLVESAKNSLNRILTAIGALEHLLGSGALDREFVSSDEQLILTEAEALNMKFMDAMDEDFNTADAIAAIFELVKLANTHCNASSSKEFVQTLQERLVNLCSILGLETKKEEDLLDEEIEKLIEERQAARKNKDFARSDEIRNLLLDKGIILEDTREGVRWKRS
jgi:cysteinyl-tRNA synthetase